MFEVDAFACAGAWSAGGTWSQGAVLPCVNRWVGVVFLRFVIFVLLSIPDMPRQPSGVL